MTADDIKALRKSTGLGQRDLADALGVDVALVREWEKGERFPTKAHCERMEAVRAKPPPRKGPGKRPRTAIELLADPAFFALLRKLLAHGALRAECEKLAEGYADPLEARADDA